MFLNAKLLLGDYKCAGTAFVDVLYNSLAILYQRKRNILSGIECGSGIVGACLIKCNFTLVIIKIV
jgi:hypothetical protein